MRAKFAAVPSADQRRQRHRAGRPSLTSFCDDLALRDGHQRQVDVHRRGDHLALGVDGVAHARRGPRRHGVGRTPRPGSGSPGCASAYDGMSCIGATTSHASGSVLCAVSCERMVPARDFGEHVVLKRVRLTAEADDRLVVVDHGIQHRMQRHAQAVRQHLGSRSSRWRTGA